MTKHTKEPWGFDDFGMVKSDGEMVNLGGFALSGSKQAKPNDKRIVACVNALAGIDDPESFMRDVREYVKSPNAMDHMYVKEHLKGGDE